MRIGLFTPVVAQPRGSSPWERTAGVDDLAVIAAAADRLGYHHLTCCEHVAVPDAVARSRGGTYWDPLATFGFLAARTDRITFVTQVLVLGYHHPLEIAKRYGTLDLVTGGRLVLGVGVGSLREEFDLLGAEFDDRGAIADDAMSALRASLGRSAPVYSGPHFRFDGIRVEPHALRTDVPLWVGGRSTRSLRRALTLGDGWVPFGLSHERLAAMLAGHTVPPGFDLVLEAREVLDPLGDPSACMAALASTRDAGATIATVTVRAESAAHYCDQLARLTEVGRDVGVVFD
ncbi:TIGR03619 family F420-dependent LLM class oxidoreductase [Gordonia sp. HY285]|uniref:TIGR03619 family F420-dependent LLM class oxidoreductase n=1 Tax=Gordonia liuliyuniae TaxID=2911517 RepID=UPI001F00C1FD|nr:TIGR03619 family F420-dependent LLM class oxidoreductase [Gordonia liuliyuniae]MCF8610426.1 TIGR03619 family F420-dependent LLM class oxidoreductase [Gordonia liuliyuniae]